MTWNNRLKQTIADVTGEWAFYLPMFYFAAPLSILSSALQDFDPNKPFTFLLWLFASVIGFLAMLLVAYISKNIFRNSKNQNWKTLLAYFFFAFVTGGTKGLITGIVGGQLVAVTQFDNALIPRTVTSGLIGALIIPAGSLFLANRKRLSEKRDGLVRELVQIEMQTEQNIESLEGLDHLAFKDTRSNISLQIERLLSDISKLDEIPATSQWELISVELKRIVEENIKPASKSLWQTKISEYPKLKFGETIALAISQFSFPMSFVIITNALGTSAQFVRHSQGMPLVQTLIWTVLSILLPYLIMRLVVRKHLLPGKIAFFTMILFSVSLESFRLHQNAVNTNTLILNFNSFIFGTFLIFTLLTGGFISTSLKSQNQEIKSLSELVDQDRVKLVALEIAKESANRDLAKYLHGQVQTRLMSLALALDLAKETKDSLQAQKALDELNKMVSEPASRKLKNTSESINQIFSRIESSWGALVNISFHNFPIENNLTPTELENIQTIAEEAVTNSVRHGLANNVEISVEISSQNQIEISIIDDGTGLIDAKSGLGSSLFTSICGNNWTLKNRYHATGVEFLATINR